MIHPQPQSLEKKFMVKGVNIWRHDSTLSKQDILVEDGIVTAIEPTSQINFEGQIIEGEWDTVIPAGVDPQVHLRFPGQEYKETPDTGMQAAIGGGISCFLNMPNTNPTMDSVTTIQKSQEQLKSYEERYGIKVYLSGAITMGLKSRTPAPVKDLVEAGAIALTDDGYGVTNDDYMRAAFAESERSGVPVLQHAEYPGHGGVIAEGPIQEKLGIKPYPRDAEIDMVKRDLELLKEYPKARYHVLHASARETIGIVKEARERGLIATCEATPHHLLFSSSDMDPDNTSFKMNPPLRFAEDRDALREGLACGDVAFISTDHAPHESTAKGRDYKVAAFGTTALEVSLRTLLKLHFEGTISKEKVVEAFSTAPARFLGLDEEFGHIKKGKPFYGVFIKEDPELHTVGHEELLSKSKNSCFIGTQLPEGPCAVINRNKFFGKTQ